MPGQGVIHAPQPWGKVTAMVPWFRIGQAAGVFGMMLMIVTIV